MLSENEILAAIGLELAMSICPLNRISNYWSEKCFGTNDDYRKTMSSKIFQEIRSNLNFTPEITESENTNIHRHIFHDMDGMRKMKDSLVIKNKDKENPCISLVESLKINYPTMDEDTLNCITSNDVEVVDNIFNCNRNDLSIVRKKNRKKVEEKIKKWIKISNTLECTRVEVKRVMMSGESIDCYGRKKMRMTWTTDRENYQ